MNNRLQLPPLEMRGFLNLSSILDGLSAVAAVVASAASFFEARVGMSLISSSSSSRNMMASIDVDLCLRS